MKAAEEGGKGVEEEGLGVMGKGIAGVWLVTPRWASRAWRGGLSTLDGSIEIKVPASEP